MALVLAVKSHPEALSLPLRQEMNRKLDFLPKRMENEKVCYGPKAIKVKNVFQQIYLIYGFLGRTDRRSFH